MRALSRALLYLVADMHIKATIHVVKDKGAVALYNRSELVSWSKNLLNKLFALNRHAGGRQNGRMPYAPTEIPGFGVAPGLPRGCRE